MSARVWFASRSTTARRPAASKPGRCIWSNPRQLLAERRLEALQGVELVVEASHLGVLLASSPGVAAFGGVALRAADALDRVGVVVLELALLLLPRLAPSLAELVLELGVVLLDGRAELLRLEPRPELLLLAHLLHALEPRRSRRLGVAQVALHPEAIRPARIHDARATLLDDAAAGLQQSRLDLVHGRGSVVGIDDDAATRRPIRGRARHGVPPA